MLEDKVLFPSEGKGQDDDDDDVLKTSAVDH